ncbi:hypothetical protein K440DRAFT_661839 [Wilcoxina mikolae CBS 423.85]|nr:hypothetical protein K440DRAFT_661839 [Wilcoxina mikolae CBS 423.85]
MVTITQEGNLSAPHSSGLFQDVKFWFSLLVPTRSSLMSSVRLNGGIIVTVEKDADFCIVDHARPPTSSSVNRDKSMYSYRYITESIRRGQCENADAYRVDPTRTPQKKAITTGTVRATTSKPIQMVTGGRSKRGRNPFTKEDDLILMRAISKPGVKTSGNKVYQEIGSEHPSHTFHGWRGRWLDHYSKLNPDPLYWYKELKKSAGIGEDDSDDGEEVAAVRPEPRRTLPKQNPPKSIPHRRQDEFTAQDDRILEKYHKTVEKATDPLEVWEQLEEQYPHHRASHWRKRYSGVVLPRLKDRAALRRSSGTISPIPVPQQQTPIKDEFSQRDPSSAAKSKISPKLIPSSAIKPKPSPRLQPSSGNSSSTPKLTAEVLPPNKSKQSTQEYVSRWRVQVGPKHSGVTSPTPTSNKDKPSIPAHPITPQANNKRKRTITPHSYGLSRDVEIPSTPEHSRPTKQPRRREPSPELDFSHPLPFGPGEDDLDLVIPSLPSMGSEDDSPFLPVSVPNNDNTPRKSKTTMFHPSPSSPPPEEDPDLMIPPLNTGLDPSTTSSRESTPDPDEVTNFLATLMKKYPGLTTEKVVWALHRAGADEELTEAVLVADLNGEGLPDLPGVWSEEEDEILKGGNGRELEELVKRKDDWEVRWTFLEEWEMTSPSRRKSGGASHLSRMA